MATAKLKSVELPPAEQISAVDALTAITLTVLRARNVTKPTLSDVAGIARRASSPLRIKDLDEKITVENQATMALARQFNLMN